jgi:hypothetical protein
MRPMMLTVLLFLVAGCVSSYGEMDLSGGATAESLSPTTMRVYARALPHSPKEMVTDFAILRAAEETLKAGYGHFLILNSGSTIMSEWYNVTLKIEMRPGPRPPDVRAWDAHQTVAMLGPKYKR